jgi:hypothetical protein
MLMSWPPSGDNTTTHWSPPYLSRLPWLPRVYSLASSARRLSPSSLSRMASSRRALLLPALLDACSTPLVGDLPRSPRVSSLGTDVESAVSIIRCPLSAAESTNLSTAWQSEVKASRSLLVSLPSTAPAAPGLMASPPRGRPGSPGFRIPIRTSKASGSIPRPSSRPLSCFAISGALLAAAAVDSSGGSVPLAFREDSPVFQNSVQLHVMWPVAAFRWAVESLARDLASYA